MTLEKPGGASRCLRAFHCQRESTTQSQTDDSADDVFLSMSALCRPGAGGPDFTSTIIKAGRRHSEAAFDAPQPAKHARYKRPTREIRGDRWARSEPCLLGSNDELQPCLPFARAILTNEVKHPKIRARTYPICKNRNEREMKGEGRCPSGRAVGCAGTPHAGFRHSASIANAKRGWRRHVV